MERPQGWKDGRPDRLCADAGRSRRSARDGEGRLRRPCGRERRQGRIGRTRRWTGSARSSSRWTSSPFLDSGTVDLGDRSYAIAGEARDSAAFAALLAANERDAAGESGAVERRTHRRRRSRPTASLHPAVGTAWFSPAMRRPNRTRKTSSMQTCSGVRRWWTASISGAAHRLTSWRRPRRPVMDAAGRLAGGSGPR